MRAIVAGLLLSLLILATVAGDLPHHSEDSSAYLRMAAGDDAQVLRPFALRIVHTGAAGFLSRTTGLSVDASFLVLALLACWSLLASTFGVLPALLWAHRAEVAASWRQAPLWLRSSLVYGLLLFFAAPAAGTQLTRLVGYGWPAFWFAVPLLATIVPSGSRRRLLLAGLHVTAAWGVPLLRSSQPVSVFWLGVALVLAVACNLAAARLWRPARTT